MVFAEVDIVNRRGLHARAAAKLVQAASGFESQVTIAHGEEEADGKSILSLMVLGACQGTKLRISIEGEDEQDALAALVELIAGGFDEQE
ncbi:MAG: HPr family phosphocarrier protein [Acidobacteriota bacterium]